jgi:hypothetical protein
MQNYDNNATKVALCLWCPGTCTCWARELQSRYAQSRANKVPKTQFCKEAQKGTRVFICLNLYSMKRRHLSILKMLLKSTLLSTFFGARTHTHTQSLPHTNTCTHTHTHTQSQSQPNKETHTHSHTHNHAPMPAGTTPGRVRAKKGTLFCSGCC